MTAFRAVSFWLGIYPVSNDSIPGRVRLTWSCPDRDPWPVTQVPTHWIRNSQAYIIITFPCFHVHCHFLELSFRRHTRLWVGPGLCWSSSKLRWHWPSMDWHDNGKFKWQWQCESVTMQGEIEPGLPTHSSYCGMTSQAIHQDCRYLAKLILKKWMTWSHMSHNCITDCDRSDYQTFGSNVPVTRSNFSESMYATMSSYLSGTASFRIPKASRAFLPELHITQQKQWQPESVTAGDESVTIWNQACSSGDVFLPQDARHCLAQDGDPKASVC